MQDFGYITSLSVVSVGKTASLGVSTVSGYIRKIELTNDGFGYTKVPTVSITPAPAGGVNATAVAITTSVGDVSSVKEILLINPGSGYTVAPTVTINSFLSTMATLNGSNLKYHLMMLFVVF